MGERGKKGEALGVEVGRLALLSFGRQLPARDVLDFLPKIRYGPPSRRPEESFGRKPDRIAPHGPLALSAALRCDLNRSSAT